MELIFTKANDKVKEKKGCFCLLNIFCKEEKAASTAKHIITAYQIIPKCRTSECLFVELNSVNSVSSHTSPPRNAVVATSTRSRNYH